MPDWVIYNYRAILPVAHPVRARPGDVIRVRPGHPRAAVAVWRYERNRWIRIRVGPPNYGALIVQEYDGIIEPLVAGQSLAAQGAA